MKIEIAPINDHEQSHFIKEQQFHFWILEWIVNSYINHDEMQLNHIISLINDFSNKEKIGKNLDKLNFFWNAILLHFKKFPLMKGEKVTLQQTPYLQVLNKLYFTLHGHFLLDVAETVLNQAEHIKSFCSPQEFSYHTITTSFTNELITGSENYNYLGRFYTALEDNPQQSLNYIVCHPPVDNYFLSWYLSEELDTMFLYLIEKGQLQTAIDLAHLHYSAFSTEAWQRALELVELGRNQVRYGYDIFSSVMKALYTKRANGIAQELQKLHALQPAAKTYVPAPAPTFTPRYNFDQQTTMPTTSTPSQYNFGQQTTIPATPPPPQYNIGQQTAMPTTSTPSQYNFGQQTTMPTTSTPPQLYPGYYVHSMVNTQPILIFHPQIVVNNPNTTDFYKKTYG